MAEASKVKNDEILRRLHTSLGSFSEITGIPVTVYDEKGNIGREFHDEDKLCSRLSVYSLRNGGCRKMLLFAGEFSSHLGEPYIFLCKAGFSNISVPIIISGEFRGFAVAGPFIMKKLRPNTIRNMLNMNRLDENEKSMITAFAENMPIYSSSQITDLSVLLYNCVLSSMTPPSDYVLLNKKSEEQRTISSKIRSAKNEALLDSGFNKATEAELVKYILNNDIDKAETMIRRILDNFSVISVGNLDDTKTLSLWATATVVRSLSNELSTKYGEDLDVDIDIINRITEADTLADLSEAFMFIINHVSSTLVSSLYTGSSLLISSSLKYIKSHFAEKISLADMCSELHVNPTYFSYLFSKEMGQSFVDYITEVRLSKAEELLISTELSILDVSALSGFENQSYFSKVFKARNGVTPREYRKSAGKTE